MAGGGGATVLPLAYGSKIGGGPTADGEYVGAGVPNVGGGLAENGVVGYGLEIAGGGPTGAANVVGGAVAGAGVTA
jgi:hypothetical protein